MPPQISIIVPLFNEAGNVQPLVQQVLAAFAKETRPFELVLVDDASTDDTWALIERAHRADPRVRGLRHAHNCGQSAALWSGFRATRSPIIATLDGDLQNDPADFPALLPLLETHDLVCGVRVRRQDNALRLFSTKVARAATKAILGKVFQDPGCGIRVFRRSVLDTLFPFNGLHRFMALLVFSAGGTVAEVPGNHRPRAAGISKYGVWNRMGRGLADLLAIRWYLKRRIDPRGVAIGAAVGGGSDQGT